MTRNDQPDGPDPGRVKLLWGLLALVAVGLVAVWTPRLLAGDEVSQPLPPPPTAAATTTSVPPSPTPEPTPSATPSATPIPRDTGTATPAATETPDELAALRESTMWVNLAEWDRALTGRKHLDWGSVSAEERCQYGEFSNAEEVWNSFAPKLRDEMLRMVIDEGIKPDVVRYPGKPIEDHFVSGVLGWWTNAAAPEFGVSGGKGSMYMAQASYVTAEGESRIRRWPVLIGHAQTPEESREAYLRAIGPAQDIDVATAPDTYEGNNEVFNAHHIPWLESQSQILEPVDPPLPPEC